MRASLLFFFCAACASMAPESRRAAVVEPVPASAAPAAPAESWCGIEDVVEGPVTAVLHQPGRPTMACRIGRSPKYELLRQVQRDAVLARCLANLSEPAWAEVTLLIDGQGRVSALDVDDETSEERLGPCLERVRAFRTEALGCRWRLSVTLGVYRLD